MDTTNENLKHHVRQSYCHSRLKYREGKQLTAVKVYSVITESKHLLVFGVPKINLKSEIKAKLIKFGPIQIIECVTNNISRDVELEQFTDCFHVIFEKLEHSRKAKKYLDARNFYGGILHITYASERETIDELRQKLRQRASEVGFRLKKEQKDREHLKRINESNKNNEINCEDKPSTSKIIRRK